VGVFLYQGTPPETFALYVILGSGAMGMWASTLGGASYSLGWERRWGTVQYTFITPASQLWITAGRSLIHAAVGLMVLVEILIVTTLLFGVQLTIASPWAFFLATLLTISAFAVIGLLLNSLFMLTRSASHWQNALTRFLYVFCGVMYPISVLPDWLRPISYVLAPTWSLEATRLSVAPGALSNPRYLRDIGLTLLLMAVYLLLARYVQGVVEHRVRVTADLERI
jgi:ABC-2 type transport system permease protein